jgi:predicted nuclease with TOPRIM domain
MATEWSPTDLVTLGSTAAASGALLTEILRRLLPTRDKVLEDGAAIRLELRTAVAELQAEVRSLRGEVDHWQGQYYDLREQHSTLQGQHQSLRAELDELRQRMPAAAGSPAA